MNVYDFGNYIFELRRKAGLSQTDLAETDGVDRSSTSARER